MLLQGIAYLLLFAAPSAGPTPPAQEILDAISSRGRELAAYDFAAWHGSNAFMAIEPNLSEVSHYIPYRDQDTWKVAFGRRNSDDTAFLVTYQAIRGKDGRYHARRVEPPVKGSGFLLRASVAIDLAREDFGTVDRPYNTAALPTPDNDWWVYLFPASTEEGIWPIGGDARYTISKDGKRIITKRRLHNSVLETGPPDFETKPVASMHVHVLECIPEDTDVLAVLSGNPPVYVICDPFSFAIDEDGSVRFIGHSEELWGIPDVKEEQPN